MLGREKHREAFNRSVFHLQSTSLRACTFITHFSLSCSRGKQVLILLFDPWTSKLLKRDENELWNVFAFHLTFGSLNEYLSFSLRFRNVMAAIRHDGELSCRYWLDDLSHERRICSEVSELWLGTCWASHEMILLMRWSCLYLIFSSK